MTTPMCGSCQHFHPIKPTGPVVLNDNSQPHGLCRINPPQVFMIPIPAKGGIALQQQSTWPTVTRHDACGSHTAKVNL